MKGYQPGETSNSPHGITQNVRKVIVHMILIGGLFGLVWMVGVIWLLSEINNRGKTQAEFARQQVVLLEWLTKNEYEKNEAGKPPPIPR